jgi:hypothetical protein
MDMGTRWGGEWPPELSAHPCDTSSTVPNKSMINYKLAWTPVSKNGCPFGHEVLMGDIQLTVQQTADGSS